MEMVETRMVNGSMVGRSEIGEATNNALQRTKARVARLGR